MKHAAEVLCAHNEQPMFDPFVVTMQADYFRQFLVTMSGLGCD